MLQSQKLVLSVIEVPLFRPSEMFVQSSTPENYYS